MNDETRLKLASFDDGRAVVEISYGARRARLELDLVEHRRSGQSNAEATRDELADLARAVDAWLADPASRLRTD